MSDLQKLMAENAWRRLVESRRQRNRLRRISFIVLSSLAVALLFFCFLSRESLSRLSPLTVREIVVSSNRAICESELLELLDIHVGDPWWSYNPREIHERASLNPRIDGLAMRYAWFHQLHVTVTEREPTLAVLGETEGELTSDGWFLPRRRIGEEIDLPVYRAVPGALPAHGHRVDPQTTAIARLVGSLSGESPGLWRDLSEIEMACDHARAYLRSRSGVIMFTPGMHEELWQRVPEVLDHLRLRERDDVVLDLRFRGRIVVRLPEADVSDTLVTATPFEKV